MMVCRICLNADRKMFALNKQLYENVTGVLVPPLDRLPKYMCWECKHYLSKFFTFRSTAVTSHFILMEILRTQDITSNALKKYQPKSPLMYTRTLYLHLKGLDCDELEESEAKDDDGMEYTNLTDHIWEVNVDNFDDSDEICVKTEVDDKTDYISDVAFVKIEESVDGNVNIVEMPKENDVDAEIEKEIDYNDCIEIDSDVEITNENVDKVTDIEQGIEKEQSNKNINSMERLDLQLEDDTDDSDDSPKCSQKNDKNNSKSIGDTSTKSTRKIELDKTLFTVATLTTEEQIAEWKKKAVNDEYVKSPHKCLTCFEGFSDTVTFNGHMELHSVARGQYQCPVCKVRFPRRLLITIHMRRHSQRISCQECDYVTHTNSLAYKHQLVHRGKRFECQLCEAAFAHSASYFCHIRIKHPSNVICRLCGHSFINDAGLRMHERRIHSGDQKTIPEDGPYCERCDLRFLSQEAFDTHKIWSAKHVDDERVGKKIPRRRKKRPSGGATGNIPKANQSSQYPCEQCGQILPDPTSYYKHFKIEHKGKNRTMFFSKIHHYVMCEVCGKICLSASSLRIHQERHKRGNKFKCERCGKEYSKPRYLKYHQEKPCGRDLQLPCRVCKKMLSRSNFRRHMETHRGITYKCEICQKEFKHPADKRNHVNFVHKKIPRPIRNRRKQRQAEKQPADVNNSNSNSCSS